MGCVRRLAGSHTVYQAPLAPAAVVPMIMASVERVTVLSRSGLGPYPSIYSRSWCFFAATLTPPPTCRRDAIFAAGDGRPKTCLRDETYAQRRKSRPHDREKPAENGPFRRQVFHGEFRWTGWWRMQSSANRSLTRLRELTGQIRESGPLS